MYCKYKCRVNHIHSQYPPKEEFLAIVSSMSIKAASKYYKCDRNKIKDIARFYNISLPVFVSWPSHKCCYLTKRKECEYCGVFFSYNNKMQKFCSYSCFQEAKKANTRSKYPQKVEFEKIIDSMSIQAASKHYCCSRNKIKKIAKFYNISFPRFMSKYDNWVKQKV